MDDRSADTDRRDHGGRLDELYDRDWLVTSVDATPVDSRPPSLRFAADGSLSGFTGVNRMFGRFEIIDGRLSVGGAGVTRMAGPPEAMQLESTLLDVINAGGAIAWSAGSMQIESGERRVVLSAEPVVAERSVVSGSVAYRERIAMPPGAILTVTLLDVSRADAPGVVVASLTEQDPGNVPIRFELQYDRERIDPRHSYSVRVAIDVGGELWWTSTDAHLVITGGHRSEVDIVLSRVRR